MGKKFVFLLLVLPCLIFGLISCDSNEEKVQIVATLFPQYDFAKQIAGQKYSVDLLVDPGVESHTYDPSGKDMRKIYSCDLLIYTGDNMEPWVQQLAGDQNCKGKIVDVSKNIALGSPSFSHDHENSHNHTADPHIWTSPKNAIIMVDNILSALCEKYPQDAVLFTQNAKQLTHSLQSLDAQITDIVTTSKRNTLYFGGRNAFYYFTRDYNLDYMSAYDSCSEDTEPTLKTLALMTQEITNNNIPVILGEELSNNKVASSLCDSTGAKLMIFHSCHNVSKDDFEKGVTYIDLMTQNTLTLREALN